MSDDKSILIENCLNNYLYYYLDVRLILRDYEIMRLRQQIKLKLSSHLVSLLAVYYDRLNFTFGPSSCSGWGQNVLVFSPGLQMWSLTVHGYPVNLYSCS